MDLIVYVAAGLLTLGWSVSVYTLWTEKVQIRSSETVPVFFLVFPSLLYLGFVIIGASAYQEFRLDISGLLLQSAVLLASVIVLFIMKFSLKKSRILRKRLQILLAMNVSLSVLNLILHVLIKQYPPYLLLLGSFINSLRQMDLFSMSWLYLAEQTDTRQVAVLLNRLFIAAVSYLPIFLLRFFLIWQNTRRLKSEVRQLEERVKQLENRP